MKGHFKTIFQVKIYWLKKLCHSEDLNNTCSETSMSLMNGHLKTIFSVLLYKCKEICVLGSPNSNCAESLSQCHQQAVCHFKAFFWVDLYWLGEFCPLRCQQQSCSLFPSFKISYSMLFSLLSHRLCTLICAYCHYFMVSSHILRCYCN